MADDQPNHDDRDDRDDRDGHAGHAGHNDRDGHAGRDDHDVKPDQPFAAELGPLVEEVRRLAVAVGEKAQEVGGRLREQNPEVYGHLAAAGGELLAAYRAVVAGQERRWAAPGHADGEHIDLDEPSDK
ncbi:DUF5304 family protein [Kitasatospora sp. MAP5-34]|uniref:DUF5304 family protein n=1 Tax=Kitasatospora sp. MAP5-34 TaxID=3035102 RepID=UPI0024757137|nr:DUF5304 family protein [Kitasatospora sp. MAP5-34]MDH6575110.1 hypothetical protein [Kitasatospora sp. MAP5-34]